MKKNDISHSKGLLSSPKNIAIVCHWNPDGDAYGASLALYHYLLKKEHNVTVISPNDCPEFLKWMPGEDSILVFENETTRGTEVLRQAEIVFTLDFNALHRVGDTMYNVLKNISPVFIMIDHHKQPEGYAHYMYSDEKMSSTSEMVYRFLTQLDSTDFLDKDIAACLYAGMVTDTASFKYPLVNAETLRIAAKLLETGIDHTDIQNNLYDTNSLNRLHLLGKALRSLKILEEYNTAYITIPQSDLNSFAFKKGDTEGFVNYGLSLKGVVFAAIFIEDQKQKIIKISFRSKGSFCVNEFARRHFDGGGHENAAGGRSELNLKETVAKFVKVVKEYKEELNAYH